VFTQCSFELRQHIALIFGILIYHNNNSLIIEVEVTPTSINRKLWPFIVLWNTVTADQGVHFTP